MEAAILTLIVTNIVATVGFSLQIGQRIDKLSDRVGVVEQRLARLFGAPK